MEQKDSILYKIVQLVSKLRNNANDQIPFELECRIGQFTTQGKFVAGYEISHKALISRLLAALKERTKLSTNWSQIDSYSFVRSNYSNHIRSTHFGNSSNKPTEYLCKKIINHIDLKTDNREYDVRFSLASEKPIQLKQESQEIYNMITKNEPDRVCVGRRTSFLEIVNTNGNLDVKNDFDFQLRYDISQISKAGRTKKEACEQPCDYHCEIEIYNKLQPLTNKTEEHKQDVYIAKVLLSRMSSLLGTFTSTPTGPKLLPPPLFYFLK